MEEKLAFKVLVHFKNMQIRSHTELGLIILIKPVTSLLLFPSLIFPSYLQANCRPGQRVSFCQNTHTQISPTFLRQFFPYCYFPVWVNQINNLCINEIPRFFLAPHNISSGNSSTMASLIFKSLIPKVTKIFPQLQEIIISFLLAWGERNYGLQGNIYWFASMSFSNMSFI